MDPPRLPPIERCALTARVLARLTRSKFPETSSIIASTDNPFQRFEILSALPVGAQLLAISVAASRRRS